MFHQDDFLFDSVSRKENLITGIEARSKIVFTVIALVINLLSPTIFTPVAIAGFCLITLIVIGIPLKTLIMRLTIPLLMAAVILILQVFFYGSTPMFTITLWGLTISGYIEGLKHGFLIVCRVIGGVSLILFLSMSTPGHKLLLAARWFRVPRVMVELTLLIYRYIFVLIEEALTIRDAQKVRLSYYGFKRSINSLGVLGGSLVLRAYDRAERVFEAMVARGYTGSMAISYTGSFGRKDFIAASCLCAALAVFYFAGRLG